MPPMNSVHMACVKIRAAAAGHRAGHRPRRGGDDHSGRAAEPGVAHLLLGMGDVQAKLLESMTALARDVSRAPAASTLRPMNKADAMGFVLAAVARLITGAQGHWKGVPPKAEQRIYFANHQSHLDWVLVWATLPADLRVQTRPIAAADYWTKTPLKHWITREVFRAVYVDRERKEGGPDPLAPLIAALEQGDSLVIFPGRHAQQQGPAAGLQERHLPPRAAVPAACS